MNTQPPILQEERVDDIPLMMGILRRMNIAEILDKHLGRHYKHQGVSSGILSIVWLTYILTQSDHRKSAVEEWTKQHRLALQALLGCTLRSQEFIDDRLGILLRRLAQANWQAIETDLFHASFSIYRFPTDCVRLDSTTSCGYHAIEPDGVMQLGHSKDHRPDLPQLKIMAGVSQPLAFPLVTAIVPGNRADDELYWPAIVNVKALLRSASSSANANEPPLLFCGDRKMASLNTRGRIANGKDFYLTVLPHTGTTAKLFDSWVAKALDNEKTLIPIWPKDAQDETPIRIARGYEFERDLATTIEREQIVWTERVQILQSDCRFDSQKQLLEKRLRQVEKDLWALTMPGPGRRIWRVKKELGQEIDRLLQTNRVDGLLRVEVRKQEKVKRRTGKPGRPRKGEAVPVEKDVRYQVSKVSRHEEAIREKQRRLGWYAQATNAGKERLSLEGSVLTYREGAGLERPFHQLKDTPLGIRPLFVQREEQITGLTRLLLIGLRVLTLVEVVVRAKLEARGEQLEGLYEGQKNRKEGKPTAKRLLAAIARLPLTLNQVLVNGEYQWHLTPLPNLLLRVLELLDLSPSLYTALPTTLSNALPSSVLCLHPSN
jgi:transposase